MLGTRERLARFTNWREKEFSWKWNGEEYTFNPGQTMILPQYLAEHFAKHLTNMSLTEDGLEQYCSPKKPVDVSKFMEYFKKSYSEETELGSEEVSPLKAAILEANKDTEKFEESVEEVKNIKRGRPKKVEDDFEGLN